MKFVLPILAMLPAVFGDGGLRALSAQEPSKITDLGAENSPHKGAHRYLQMERTINGERRLTGFSVYSSLATYKLGIEAIISQEPQGFCDHFVETFGAGSCPSYPGDGCGIPNPSGTGFDYPALTWETTGETIYDTRVEDGKFWDRLTRANADATIFKYPALEGWGGTFDLDPAEIGQGLDITVYADGDEVDTFIVEGGGIFWGVIATEPIDKIKIVAGPTVIAPGGIAVAETYTLDDVQIFPWCTAFPSGLKGDPHVETWLGDYFDFMGQCDVVYLQDKAHDIDIHARTTIRYDYSYVESAAVRIGEDVLEVSSFGEHFINGVDMADNVGSGAGYTVGGYPVYYSMKNKRTHQFDIVLGDGKNITIGTFKDLVSVSTKGAEVISYFEQSTGILGNVYGHLLGRDGETEYQIKDQKEMDVFGQEWQVGAEDPKLFQTDRAPQYPAKCIFPSDEVKEGRRLSESPIELNAAEMACARFAGATFQKCVYDVMAFGDLEVAESGIY